MRGKLLYSILLILIGLVISIPLILVYKPIFINSNKSTIFYILLFPMIFALVSLSLVVGIKQKCIKS